MRDPAGRPAARQTIPTRALVSIRKAWPKLGEHFSGQNSEHRAGPSLAIGLSEKTVLGARSASVGSKLMRRVVAVLVACTPHAAAAAALVAREQSVLESGARAAAPVDDVHQPFTTVLSSVHATLFNVTRDVETVEQSGPGSGPVSQLRQHTESALYEIEQVLGL